MSTFTRIIIVIIEFLALAVFEFFFIRMQLKRYTKLKWYQNKESRLKKFKIFTCIFYPVLNVLFIIAFLFMFPNHIFLCYNKLIFLGGVVIAIISLLLVFSWIMEDNLTSLKANMIIIFTFLFIPLSLTMSILPILTDFNNYIVLETTEQTENITNFDTITKLNDRNDNVICLINYKDKASDVIYEYQINHFSLSDTTSISKLTTTTTYELVELKNNKKYTETKITYSIYVNPDILIDSTKN